jgi:hypothetical protein
MKTPHLKKRYILAIVFIALIFTVLFAAPRIGRLYVVKHSKELLGRSIAIDRIRINYFTGTFSVYDLKLFEQDGSTVFTSFNRLSVNLDYLPLFRNEILVKYIILDDPYAQVIQNGDKFNFTDLMQSDSAAVRKDTIPSKPVKYIINNIRISRGFVKYTDKVLDHTISMSRIDLDIPGFTWNSDSTKLGLDFRFVDGGRLFSDLDLNQADSTYSVNLKLDSLNLDIIEPYVAGYMNISALHGQLSSNLKIKGDMRSVMRMVISGTGNVRGFELLDSLKRKIFTADEITADIESLLPEKSTISLSSIDFRNPYILFEMIDSSNNWLRIMKPTPETPPDTLRPQPSTETTDNPFTFKNMSITGGTLQIMDRSIRFPFDYTLDNIAMTGWADKEMPGWIDISMKAGLNKTGTVTADMAFNPMNSNELDMSVAISQFLMKDVEPYFRHYLGFPVTGGRMNFNSKNKLRIGSVSSNNSIYFRKFTLAKKTPEKTEYNIPLRLALGIMSDKDGIIDLKAPVEMMGENIKVGNLRRIIFRTIGNLFIKAAVSPVNMIGQLFNIDPEKLREIRLQPLEASPDQENLETADVLADILNKKPGLALDMIYCINRERTYDTLAHLMALEKYNQTSNAAASVPDSTLAKFISGKMPADTTNKDLNINSLCRKFIGTEKLNSRLDSVKSAQITFLQNYLTRDKAVPADRFRINSSMPDTLKFDGAVPVFRTFFNAGEEKQ